MGLRSASAGAGARDPVRSRRKFAPGAPQRCTGAAAGINDGDRALSVGRMATKGIGALPELSRYRHPGLHVVSPGGRSAAGVPVGWRASAGPFPARSVTTTFDLFAPVSSRGGPDYGGTWTEPNGLGVASACRWCHRGLGIRRPCGRRRPAAGRRGTVSPAAALDRLLRPELRHTGAELHRTVDPDGARYRAAYLEGLAGGVSRA